MIRGSARLQLDGLPDCTLGLVEAVERPEISCEEYEFATSG
jgi:hypothetical protein